ncbi:MAG: beta strand repeat-containing protein, partial [Chloroflexota bacterium]
LDGSAGVNRAFLVGVGGGGTTLRGLQMVGFTNNVVRFNTAGNGGNKVLGSEISSCGCAGSGVLIDGTSGNEIGSSFVADRNTIGFNGDYGVEIRGNANNNVVRNNYIGVDASGLSPFPNGQSGVRIAGGDGNVIGGTNAGDRNVISGNISQGIKVAGGSNHRIQGNFIGAAADGSYGANVGSGVNLEDDGVTGVLIGGVTPGAGNLIAFNGRDGVHIGRNDSGTASGISVLGNSIHTNFDLGIDIGAAGVSPNDADDSDTGPNNLQNYPSSVSAHLGTVGSVGGTLVSVPNKTYRIEAFRSASCNSSAPRDFGEGETILGAVDLALGASGVAKFFLNATSLALGDSVTTTATELQAGAGSTPLSTSEFSQCVQAAQAGVTVTPTSGLNTTESGAQATFNVRLDTVPFAAVTINLSSTNPVEGAVSPASLVFQPDSSALNDQTVTVTGVDDSVFDGPVVYTVMTAAALSADGAYNGLNAADVGLTNQDNDSQPTLSIQPRSLIEGTGGTTLAQFTVNLSYASTQQIQVQYQTADASATAGAACTTSGVDYLTASGTITFPPLNTAPQFIPVTICGDNRDELDEAYSVTLSAPVNATLAAASAVGTIQDDDTSLLSVADLSVQEGNVGSTIATFTISLSVSNSQAVSVQVATSNGTAVAGNDYTAVSQSVSIAAGSLSTTFSVPILGDVLDETNEIFTVTLSNPTNAQIGLATAIGTILDDDGAPSLSVGSLSVPEGDSGSSGANVQVTLLPASGQVVTVQVATNAGTALAGSDFIATGPLTLTFNPSETSKVFVVPILGDLLDEVDESFSVILSAAIHATISTVNGTAIVTIVDDDTSAFSIADVSVTEGQGGATLATFAVTLGPANSRPTSVQVATSNLSAAAGNDYIASSQTLTLNAGETSTLFTVSVVPDQTPEPNETFLVSLSNPVNAVLARSQAVGTIVDDDAGAGVVITAPSVSPGVSVRPDPPRVEREKARKRNNNTGQHDDEHTEGQVLEVRRDPPVLLIDGADGPIELRLRGDARDAVNWVRVGDYVEADGAKEHEGLYDIDDLEVDR